MNQPPFLSFDIHAVVRKIFYFYITRDMINKWQNVTALYLHAFRHGIAVRLAAVLFYGLRSKGTDLLNSRHRTYERQRIIILDRYKGYI